MREERNIRMERESDQLRHTQKSLYFHQRVPRMYTPEHKK